MPLHLATQFKLMSSLPTYTVFGNPIAHSKSPIIHQLFAQQEGVAIDYTRTLVDNDKTAFALAMRHFFQTGQGANVTLPFKTWAAELVDDLTEEARAAGAVNTLLTYDNIIIGHNTDGLGLIRDLYNNWLIDLENKKILILGAGGAARGIILPFIDKNVADITLANRSYEKAAQLAKQFNIRAQTFAELSGSFDLIINATSSSVSGSLPDICPDLFSGCLMAYDLFYADEDTAFMRWAHDFGAQKTADGLGMLVGQAAESYRLWRGFSPSCSPVLASLREKRTTKSC